MSIIARPSAASTSKNAVYHGDIVNAIGSARSADGDVSVGPVIRDSGSSSADGVAAPDASSANSSAGSYQVPSSDPKLAIVAAMVAVSSLIIASIVMAFSRRRNRFRHRRATRARRPLKIELTPWHLEQAPERARDLDIEKQQDDERTPAPFSPYTSKPSTPEPLFLTSRWSESSTSFQSTTTKSSSWSFHADSPLVRDGDSDMADISSCGFDGLASGMTSRSPSALSHAAPRRPPPIFVSPRRTSFGELAVTVRSPPWSPPETWDCPPTPDSPTAPILGSR